MAKKQTALSSTPTTSPPTDPTVRTPTSETQESETKEQQQERLNRTVDTVQKALAENRAILVVNSIQIVDGKWMPQIQIQILK